MSGVPISAYGRPRPRELGKYAPYAGGMHLELITIVVEKYDPAIDFFVKVLGFDLLEDSPSLTNDGRPKRWVVVRPPAAYTWRDSLDEHTLLGAPRRTTPISLS